MAGTTNGAGYQAGNGQAGPVEQALPALDLEETIERAREELERRVEQATTLIREHPVAALAGAVALGFLVGKLVSRR